MRRSSRQVGDGSRCDHRGGVVMRCLGHSWRKGKGEEKKAPGRGRRPWASVRACCPGCGVDSGCAGGVGDDGREMGTRESIAGCGCVGAVANSAMSSRGRGHPGARCGTSVPWCGRGPRGETRGGARSFGRASHAERTGKKLAAQWDSGDCRMRNVNGVVQSAQSARSGARSASRAPAMPSSSIVGSCPGRWHDVMPHSLGRLGVVHAKMILSPGISGHRWASLGA